MTLNADIEYVLGLVAKAGYPEFWELTPEAARELFEKTAPVLDVEPMEVARVEERRLSTGRARFRMRIYTPDAAGTLPVLLYYHGGGFVVGGLESYDAICRALAVKAGVIVVSVDYRLAPEHPFPAAVEDAVAAMEWAQVSAGAIGGAPGKLAVAGDSAGGNLAAVAAQAAPASGIDLALQALIYPVVGGAPETTSHHKFADGYLLTRRNILWFYEHYQGDPDDPRFAPLKADDLSGLAPALVIVAGFDPLHDEGVAYAERLRQAGNRVTLADYPAMVHGFFSLSGAVAEGARALDQVADAVREAF